MATFYPLLQSIEGHASNCRKRARRRGIMLLEVVIAGALSMLVLGIALTLFAGLFRWERQSRIATHERREAATLADKLREDLHDAVRVTQPAPTTLRIETETESVVEYLLEGEECLRRTVSADGGSAVPASTARFEIGPADRWHLQQAREGRRPLVTVWAMRQGSDSAEIEALKHVPLYVSAALRGEMNASAGQQEGE